MLKLILSKFADTETLEETRARIRNRIAYDNYLRVYRNIFREGEWGYFRFFYTGSNK